ncbi:DUF4373 domain-containing protein, partial [Enterococcus villorum]
MARPYKQGVDYYSVDVDFLKDIKYRKIRRSCGSQTCEILLCLLSYIYGDMGYFLRWDEDSAFLVADDVGAKEGLVEEVVSKAIQVGFFDREKYEKYKILTSNGIQKRYKLMTTKRKEVPMKKEYLVNDVNNLVNVGNNPTSTVVNGTDNTQREREKERESKVNNISPTTPKVAKSAELESDFEKLWNLYPRKERRADAFKAYKRAIKAGTTNKEIQDGIVAYTRSVANIDKQYIAQGGTWFNQQRWQDVVDEPVHHTQG